MHGTNLNIVKKNVPIYAVLSYLSIHVKKYLDHSWDVHTKTRYRGINTYNVYSFLIQKLTTYQNC